MVKFCQFSSNGGVILLAGPRDGFPSPDLRPASSRNHASSANKKSSFLPIRFPKLKTLLSFEKSRDSLPVCGFLPEMSQGNQSPVPFSSSRYFDIIVLNSSRAVGGV